MPRLVSLLTWSWMRLTSGDTTTVTPPLQPITSQYSGHVISMDQLGSVLSSPDHGWQLVTQRFAAPGGHQHEGVVTKQRAVDGLQLVRPVLEIMMVREMRKVILQVILVSR